MRAIPTLFRLDEYLGGKAGSQPFNKYARQILEGSDLWVPRRKRNGIPVLYRADGGWSQGVSLHHSVPEPEGFVVTYRGKRATEDRVPKFRFGWVPADTARLSVLRRALLVNAPELEPGKSYELCGPGICENAERLPTPQLFQHSTQEICLDLYARPLTYDLLRTYFRTKLAELGWEGVVWHGPVPFGGNDCLMMKLRVDDFVSV
jgi:hypothetical protein